MSAYALLASNAILLGVIAALGWYIHARLRRLEQEGDRITNLYLEQMQHQISVLQRDLHFLAERIESQPKRLLQHAQDGQDAETVSPYTQAIVLVQQGLDALDVAQRCGISRSEAELILSLYRNSSTS